MATSYKKPTVDYTKTNAYTKQKTSNDSAWAQAQTSLAKEALSNLLKYVGGGAATGASIGSVVPGIGTGIGAFVGAFIGMGGWLGDRIINGGKYDEQYYDALNKEITENTVKARSTQIERNDLISDAKYFVNSTKSNFVSTYGKDSFNMLEATIESFINMNSTTRGIERISNIVGGLQKDEIIGDINTRILDQSYVSYEGGKPSTVLTSEQIDSLYTSSYSLASLGSHYIEYLYNSIVSNDSSIRDSVEEIEFNEEASIKELDSNIQSLVLSNQEKFSELFLNQRSSNISAAQALGEAEAEGGASGIKASRSARTNVNITKMNQDIAQASYAIVLNSYQKQLEASIASGQLSREQVYFSSRQQMKNLKRQIESGLNDTINSYVHGAASSFKEIGKKETDVDDYMSAVEANKKALEEHSQTVDNSKEYIYSTHSATV